MKSLNDFKKSFKFIDYIINVIGNPAYWLSNYPSVKCIDNMVHTVVSDFFDKKCVIDMSDEYTIRFVYPNRNEIEIWIKNFPFAYGRVYSVNRYYHTYDLPSRYTRVLLRRFENYIKENRVDGVYNHPIPEFIGAK